ncbi:hypothetical protein [Paenibacillus cellulosilyticus]|uniref:hypothetical protein n=1 Tax=Paenibacillus cellulosilyticus TaxID=375489 RepID=UPI001FEC9046|nr:hypothetical protein [Paenibacillus cellulosilyticus]
MDGSARQEHDPVLSIAHTITVKGWNRYGLSEYIGQEQVGQNQMAARQQHHAPVRSKN